MRRTLSTARRVKDAPIASATSSAARQQDDDPLADGRAALQARIDRVLALVRSQPKLTRAERIAAALAELDEDSTTATPREHHTSSSDVENDVDVGAVWHVEHEMSLHLKPGSAQPHEKPRLSLTLAWHLPAWVSGLVSHLWVPA